jgi:hypothetical protein
MRFQYLVCLLLAGLAYGQAAPSATPPAATPSASTDKAPEIKVGPDDAVITLKGFCADATQQGDACKTVISRAQFEKLAESLQPGMSPAIRRQLATAYSRILRMSTVAEKRGLDKQPKFEEKMNFARMQVLSGELSSALQEDAGKVTDGDIDDYYKKNEASYEQATFARIFVPRAKQIVNPVVRPKAGTNVGAKASATASTNRLPTEAQKKASEEAMTKLAAGLRARAAKGEDPDTLQKRGLCCGGTSGECPEHEDGKSAPHHVACKPSGGHGFEARRSVRSDLRSQQWPLHLQAGQQRDLIGGYRKAGDSQHNFQPALSRQHAKFPGQC